MKHQVHTAKRALAALVALAMAIALLPPVSFPVFAAGGTWGGGDGSSAENAYLIEDAADLAALAANVNSGNNYAGKYFKLASDINLTDWLAENGAAEGWAPIGTMERPFSGSFDGGGNTISGLWTDRPAMMSVGLFGFVRDHTISNVHIAVQDNKAVNGRFYVGALAGYTSGGTISNCSASGTVTAASSMVGGLVGHQYGGVIDSCRFSGTVTAPQTGSSNEYVGGLIGSQQIDALLQNSSADAAVSGYQRIGGLIGGSAANQCTVRDCYSKGTVNGYAQIGGLIGQAESLLMERCYSAGTVTGTSQYIGGLVGYNSNYTLRSCYATGSVTGSAYVGGLIGIQSSGEKLVDSCYATGAVTASGRSGGLIGEINLSYPSIFTNNFFDTAATAQTNGAGNDAQATGILGKTTAEMKQKATFENWDFDGDGVNPPDWYIKEGVTYPRLSIAVDYALNGVPYNWTDSNAIGLSNDGDKLAILADTGPDTPVTINVQVPQSTVTITGRPSVTYENLHIRCYGTDITLNLETLSVTAPENQTAVRFSVSSPSDADSYAKIHTAGVCTLRGGQGTGVIINSGIAVDCLNLILEGDPMYVYGGDSRDSFGAYGIRSSSNVSSPLNKADITLAADITVTGGNGQTLGGGGVVSSGSLVVDGAHTLTARGGNTAAGRGGAGIESGNGIRISGGRVTARGGMGTENTHGISAYGKLEIENDSVVIAESGKILPGNPPGSMGFAVNGSGGVAISGTAHVTATGHDGGYGITFFDGGFTASDDAVVQATGGDSIGYNGGVALYGSGGNGGVAINDNARVTLIGGSSVNPTGVDMEGGHGAEVCGSGDFIINGGTLYAAGGSSGFGNGGIGIRIEKQSLIINKGQITAAGGDGVQGGQGIYSYLQTVITDGVVHTTGGKSRVGVKSAYGAGLRASDLYVSGGNLVAVGGDGKQSDEDINAFDAGGPGIYALNGAVLTGGSVTAHGGTAILGGYGMMTAYEGITVSDGVDLEVNGGTGTQNSGGVGMYVSFSTHNGVLNIAGSAGDVYIHGGKNSYRNESPSVITQNAYVATGNIGRIDAFDGEIKNIAGGDNLYMLTAKTSPVQQDAVFACVVKTEVEKLSPAYTYRAAAMGDEYVSMWLPEGKQIVATEGYGEGTADIPQDTDITLYNDFSITINYKEGTILRGSETQPVNLGQRFDLTAPQGYVLADGTASSMAVDSVLLAGGMVGGCAVAVKDKDIILDVPVNPLEIVLTLTYKTEDGNVKATQELNRFYNSMITENDIILPAGYTLSAFEPFLLNSGAPGLVFDFHAVPKPVAAVDIIVMPKDYEITVNFMHSGAVGTCVLTKAYDSSIIAADLTLPVGYRLPDDFADIPVTRDNISIPQGGSTGTVAVPVEPIGYTVAVNFLEDGKLVGVPFIIVQSKTIGQSITAEELELPSGYALKNFSGILVDGALIETAEGTQIHVEVMVEVQKIALSIVYQNGDRKIGGTQSLNKDATDSLAEGELSLPFGYHLEAPWSDISMDDAGAFDRYQVVGAAGTAEKIVQVHPNSVGVTVRFLQGQQERGTQQLEAVDYDTLIQAADLNGMAAGYCLPEDFVEITLSQGDPRFVFNSGTSAELTVQVVPAEYTVTVQYNDKAGSSYTMLEKTAYAGMITNVSSIPTGYGLDGFAGILLDETNANVVFDHQSRTATAAVAVKPVDYRVIINYFDGTAFVGREAIIAAYDSEITAFVPPAGYETAQGASVTVDEALHPDHKYTMANASLPVTKRSYSVQITYTGTDKTQSIEGKQIGSSVLYAELSLPGGYSTVNFADVYLDAALAASAQNGVIGLDVPVTATDMVVTVNYRDGDTVAGTQVFNAQKGMWITADMLLVPFGYEMGAFDSVEVTGSMSLDAKVSISPVKSVAVLPGQIMLTLDKDKEAYVSAVVTPSRVLDGSITWESSAPNIADVDAYGRIIPAAKGSAVIKAVSNQTKTVFGECMVTVLALGEPYAEVLPAQAGWNRQAVTVSMNLYEDSDQMPAAEISAKYKVTESALEPAYADDGSWTEYTAPFTLEADGIHYVHWYVENAAGQFSQGVGNAMRIDTALPEITSAQATAKSSSQINLTAQVFDSGSGISGYAWYFIQDGGEILLSTSEEYSHGGLQPNTSYSYKLAVTDGAGNCSEKVLQAITNRSAGSGGGSPAFYTVTFDSNGGSKVEKQRVNWDKAAQEPAAPTKEGFEFTGWYTDKELTKKYDFSKNVTKSLTLYAGWKKAAQPITPPDESDEWLERAFISGYPDGSFLPDHEISRGEVAKILYNLFGAGVSADLSMLDRFSDINASHWAANELSWAIGNSYIQGYPDKTMKPDQTITRAELASLLKTIAQREGLLDSTEAEATSFSDISGHWAYEAIVLLAGKRIIQGYPNNTFEPESPVTRAEAVTLLSRLLKRSAAFSQNKSFTDVRSDHWAYGSIMNGANGVKKTA